MFDGVKVSAVDNDTINSALHLWIAIIIDVRAEAGINTTEKSLSGLYQALADCDFKDVLALLDEYNALLLGSVSNSEDVAEGIKTFDYRQWPNNTFMEQKLNALLQPMLAGWFKSCDLPSFKRLREVFSFLKQVAITSSESLKNAAYDSWYQTEQCRISIPDGCPEQDIIASWFPKADENIWFEDCYPHHGNGQVAEGHPPGMGVTEHFGAREKYGLISETVESEAIRNLSGFDYMYSDMTLASPLPPWYDAYPTVEYESDECIVVFVPKSWKTFRTVSLESCNRMFWQQYVAQAMENSIKSQEYWLSDHYCINTEDWNRRAAQMGSVSGAYVTIDLSAASDSVLWALVEKWFSQTWLEPFLRLTRSTYAVVEEFERAKGRGIRLRLAQQKYAPMGSRLCFPVETTVFAAICEATVIAVNRRYGIEISHAGKYDYYVFGDDICIKREYVEELLPRLLELGFKVNLTKSFIEADILGRGIFRESCGVEYLKGFDVRPTKLSKPFRGLPQSLSKRVAKYREEYFAKKQTYEPGYLTARDRWIKAYDPGTIVSWMQLANNLEDYPCARDLVLHYLITIHKLPILFDEDGRRGVRSKAPTNFHVEKFYNEEYQRYDGEVLVLKPKRVRWWVDKFSNSTLSDHDDLAPIRLFQYLAASRKRERLLFPEDAVAAPLQPFADLELSFEKVELPCD